MVAWEEMVLSDVSQMSWTFKW